MHYIYKWLQEEDLEDVIAVAATAVEVMPFSVKLLFLSDYLL
jgi:hypothetical protein